MIQLRQFLPLHTSLVATYSRLYAITSSLSAAPARQTRVVSPEPQIIPSEKEAPVPAPAPVVGVRKKEAGGQKKRKKDAMDDIFGV